MDLPCFGGRSENGSSACRAALEAGFKAAGKKLDAGKSCIRFRTLEDLPLEVIGRAVAAVPMAEFVRLAKSVARKK